MASFNIHAVNGETGEFRQGVFFPELLTELNWDEKSEAPPPVSRGFIVGAQHRPIILKDRKILVPRNRGQVAWQGETSPIMRTSNNGLVYAASGSVKAERTEAGGTRFSIVAPLEGDKTIIVLVQTGLPGNGKEQEAKLLEMMAKGHPYFENHGAFALDTGAQVRVRKIRTALTRSGGILTRVNQLIEIGTGGAILVAGMMNESSVWRFVNEGGRLKRVDAGENPRVLFAKLRKEEARKRPEHEDEMPRAQQAA